jgi:hypothetical protein
MGRDHDDGDESGRFLANVFSDDDDNEIVSRTRGAFTV